MEQEKVDFSGTLRAWWWIPGLLLFLVGVYSIVNDVPYLNILWYILGWYGYLLMLDAKIYMLQGHSFISHRRMELLTMLFWSIPFWYIFEAYNFVLKNWYYVYAFQSDVAQGIFSFLSFATVLPACFFHAELMKALGLFKNTRTSPLNVDKGLAQFVFWFGFLCIILPVIFPKYAFWMVWGALLGVPDYINYKNGAPSILNDLKKGEPGRFYRLLTGGLIAGVVWEGFNYWARCKWIYTVPGLEDWKIFEMPILGFVGFPVLAVEAFAAYSLFNYYFRDGKTWELPDQEQQHKPNRKSYGILIVAGLLFSVIAYVGVLEYTLTSRRGLLSEMDYLNKAEIAELRGQGISTPELLYSAVNETGLDSLSTQIRIGISSLEQAYNQTTLLLHKGMGIKNAKLLNEVGILNIKDLLPQDPVILYNSLIAIGEGNSQNLPRLAEVYVWHRAVTVTESTKR